MIAFRITPGPLADAFQAACHRLDRLGFVSALWDRRLDVWSSDPATRALIGNRLGWLSALDFVTPHLPRLRTFADSIRSEQLSDVVLLGMGGSSLAPEVLRQVLGIADGYPRFRMLDSVDPEAVREAMEPAAQSLFIVASKSGSTIEPNVMAAEAQRRLTSAGIVWASRFVAITDPDTALHRRALTEGFRDVFVNPADIGGRYSALSFFGMVPAAVMGADLDRIPAAARAMDSACRETSSAENPAIALGALMAAGAAAGRDKLTLLLPRRLQSLGLWIEQLVAESTGKQGTGIVPIAGEAPDAAIGSDRVIVAIAVGSETPEPAPLAAAQASGAPIVELQMPDVTAIGAEFLRWEIATAAAGVLMGINPFDEPNVQQAKDATRALLDSYRGTRQLPQPEPHGSFEGARVTLSSAAQERLAGASADRFFTLMQPSDYIGILAYLPPDRPQFDEPLQEFRHALATRTGCATMFGYGPRYLHSTGQLHKGGANNGVFIVITAASAADLPIPGEPFSFGVLEMAQAIGDFQSLDRTGRRAVHVHLPSRDLDLLRRVTTGLVEGADLTIHSARR